MAALLLVALGLVAGSSCSVTRSSTSIDQNPSVVQVEFLGVFSGLWSQSCSGSVLTTHHILSTAICFSGMLYTPERRRIRAGATYRNTGGIIAEVAWENNHPAFGALGLDSDISVVRLTTGLTFSPVVQQATIINQGADLPDGLNLRHVGWPTTAESSYPSDVLLDVILYKSNREQCATNYEGLSVPETVTENMICATTTNWDQSGLCTGDFGGPLYYNDIVIGVVSFSYDCVNATYPMVSASVASYTDWIIETASY